MDQSIRKSINKLVSQWCNSIIQWINLHSRFEGRTLAIILNTLAFGTMTANFIQVILQYVDNIISPHRL